MNKLVCTIIAALVLVAIGAQAETWEYKVEEVDLITKVRVFANDVLLSQDDLEELLEPLGEDGWELTLMIPRGGTSMLLVFKRPVAASPAVAPPMPAAPVTAPPEGAPVPDPAVAPPTEAAPPVESEPEPVEDGEGNSG